jgi:hypothetical protein
VTLSIVLRAGNREFTVRDKDVVDEDVAKFIWEHGNFSCDCNRSLFIKRQCDPKFTPYECGEVIQLVSMEVVIR